LADRTQWAALAAAQQKIGLLPENLIVVNLYNEARTYFTKNG
jgi:hypothetical protein